MSKNISVKMPKDISLGKSPLGPKHVRFLVSKVRFIGTITLSVWLFGKYGLFNE